MGLFGFGKKPQPLNSTEDKVIQWPPCPYCNAPLPSPRARQCLRCHTDWHNAAKVHQVDVGSWNVLGLDTDKDYVVELCQQQDGRRYIRHRQYPSGSTDPFAVLETTPAPAKAFLAWGVEGYAKHLKLRNGQDFGFDAHGVWLTDSEQQYMATGQSWSNQNAPWVSGIPPKLPPR